MLYTECSQGTFGLRCANTCRCGRNEECDAVTGECICKSGLRGRHCNRGK